MAYSKRIWTDRTVEKPLTFILQDNGDGTHTLIPSEGSILSSGTPITADNLNNIENGIETLDQTKSPLNNPSFTGTVTIVDGKIISTVGGQALDLKAGATADHAYMGFYPDSADQNLRGGYFGYGSAGSGLFAWANALGGLDLSGSEIRLNPTGLVTVNGSAIEHRGSNANGEYAQFYNGTMFATHSIYASSGTGSSIRTMQNLAYPVTFVTTPYVFVQHRSISGKFVDHYVLNPTSTTYNIVFKPIDNGTSEYGDTIFTIFVIGRWK
jgi:hypothetical protein